MSSTAEHDHPVILFDGVCNLCAGSVQFVIERDSRKRFRFASLQSPVAERLLGRREDLEAVILLQNGKTYRKSGAALRIARQLDGLWPALWVLLVIPRLLRDAVYDWIGRRRYRMFGRREACWLPSVELADRFLNSGTEP